MDTLSFGNGESYNVNNGTATAANSLGTTALGNLGVSSYSGFVPPSTNVPVPSGQLAQGAVNIPPTTAIADPNGAGLVAGASVATMPPAPAPTSSTPSLDLATSGDYTQDPGYQTAQKGYDQSVSDYKTAAGAEPNSADLLTSAQNTSGANADLSTVNDLRTKLAAAQAKFQNAAQGTETAGINSGTPSVIYQGQQAAIQRQGAVEVGALAAQVQAAQGNYDAAEHLAEQTANLQFQDAQRKIDNLKSFIDLNQNGLSSAEKVAMSKMQAQATQKQQELDQQKEARTTALALGVSAPFYTTDGVTVVRTSDGVAFHNEKEAQAAGVNTTTWDNVQHIDNTAKAVSFETKNLGTTKAPNWVHIGYSANGNVVSRDSLGGNSGTTTASTGTIKPVTKAKAPTATASKNAAVQDAIDYITQPGNVGQKDPYSDPQAIRYAISKLPASAVAAFKSAAKSHINPTDRKALGF